MEFQENLKVHECIEEHRTSGVVTSLSVHITAYKRDALVMFAGNGTLLSHTKCTWKKPTVVGTNYRDFDNSTPLLTTSYTYTVPVSQQTDIVQPSDNSLSVVDHRTYKDKRRAWGSSYRVLEDYMNCYQTFFTNLEALNVSW